MERNKIHIKFTASFIIFAAVIIIFGNAFIFLVYMVSIFLHEWSHSICAEAYGVRMQELKLYPFGAILYGDLHNLKPKEEVFVALAGPAFNLIIAVCFVAIWWLVPEMYIYTDIVVIANLSLALFNLLPAYPLDGGRVLYGLLSFKIDHLKAFKTVYICGIIISIFFLAAYIFSLFFTANYTFMISSILILWGAFDSKKEIQFKNAISSKFSLHHLQRGVTQRRIAVSETITLYELIKLLNPNYYYVIDICNADLIVQKTINHKDLEKLVMENPVGTELNKIISAI